MEYVKPEFVYEVFDCLKEHSIEYVLLRNMGDELPYKLKKTKDIDLLINPRDKKKLKKILVSNGWLEGRHPWNFGDNFVFLYSMDKFLVFNKNNIALDICFQINCRSLNNGEWFPLDEIVQESVFKNKKEEALGDGSVFRLSNEDEFIHLLTRAVFDKKVIPEDYIEKIMSLYEKINREDVIEKLDLIFFKFTSTLLKMVAAKEFNVLRHKYLTYKDY
jgi:hypothetical protein